MLGFMKGLIIRFTKEFKIGFILRFTHERFMTRIQDRTHTRIHASIYIWHNAIVNSGHGHCKQHREIQREPIVDHSFCAQACLARKCNIKTQYGHNQKYREMQRGPRRRQCFRQGVDKVSAHRQGAREPGARSERRTNAGRTQTNAAAGPP